MHVHHAHVPESLTRCQIGEDLQPNDMLMLSSWHTNKSLLSKTIIMRYNLSAQLCFNKDNGANLHYCAFTMHFGNYSQTFQWLY